MMHYVILSSGSCGNSYVFYDGQHSILVDCGLTFTGLKKRLETHDIPLESIRALFLTHLHPDHSKGVGPVQRKLKIPAYVSDISFSVNAELMKKSRFDMSDEYLKTFSHGSSLDCFSFTVTPFRTYHDCPGSSGFYIENGENRFLLMTDTGCIPFEASEYAEKSDVFFIEANYDDALLDVGPYPEKLKKRIRGTYGHLSNSDALEFAKKYSKIGSELYFVHISDNNNTPDTVEKLMKKGIPSGVFIHVCERGVSYEGFCNE